MDEPIEPPLPAPLTPPRKECPDCKGSGKKPLKYLGEVTDPCPSCAGSGTVEVVEESLTPWQQRVESRLKNLEGWIALQQPTGPPSSSAGMAAEIVDITRKCV